MFYILLTPFIDFFESRVSFVKVFSVIFTTVLVHLVAQACLTLCDPMDCSPQGSSVHGILQARIQKGVALPSSRGSSQPRDRTQVSHNVGGFFID